MHLLTRLIVTLALISATVSIPIRPIPPPNGINQIISSYKPPDAETAISPYWLPNFSAGITPIPCHSHNDESQAIPLYQSIAVGCVSVEVDLLVRGRSLWIYHPGEGFSRDRTLKNLYLDPLMGILEKQNEHSGNGTLKGVFDASPSTSLVLMADFKDVGTKPWELFNSELEELRQKGWLTYWTAKTGVVERPLTIVVSGGSFEDVVADHTYRDVFFDAPLGHLYEGTQYDTSTSYYASIELGRAIGQVGQQLDDDQTAVIAEQVQKATTLGLKTRYWGAPRSPEVLRVKVWESLMALNVSVLNVDDLVAARDWFLFRT